jgi:hypothetical protein
MHAMLPSRVFLRLVLVAQAGLAVGAAGCELVDWEEVVEGINRPGPRPEPPPSACAAILCPVNTVCAVRDCVEEGCEPAAQCVPIPKTEPVPSACAAILCPVNTMCVAKEVTCVRAPCEPVAECVPIEDPLPPPPNPCDLVRCASGTHCEARQVQCVRAPCPPVAECVPDPRN